MADTNPNSRLEAFCDGVFAIALTLLIIDIKIPSSVTIDTTGDLWLALKHIVPSILAFLLSFSIILITWVNHNTGLKMVHKSSPSFIYANGFLMLTVVVMPFPTALMGDYILTDHAAPAVVLYESAMALQAIAWILICSAALKNQLAKSEKAALTIRENGTYGYYALGIYTLCAIIAFWFPLAIAIVTTFIWIFWMIWGMRIKHE